MADKRFIGTWRLEHNILEGTLSTRIAGTIAVYTDSHYWMKTEDIETFRFPYVANPNKYPCEIDVEEIDGEGSSHGIYRFQDDKLVLCFPDVENRPRPTEFVSTTDNGWSLSVWKRVE